MADDKLKPDLVVVVAVVVVVVVIAVGVVVTFELRMLTFEPRGGDL